MQIKKYIDSVNGDITLNSNSVIIERGTLITLQLPFNSIVLIHIDGDDLVRMAWKYEAKKQGKRQDGVTSANLLRNLGFSTIIISSGLPVKSFQLN
jgi:hypothetical protein